MPRFEATVDVDVDEFLYECSSKEILEIVQCLKDDGYIPDFDMSPADIKNITYDQKEFYKMIDILSKSYLRITPEDLDVLEKIAKKY